MIYLTNYTLFIGTVSILSSLFCNRPSEDDVRIFIKTLGLLIVLLSSFNRLAAFGMVMSLMAITYPRNKEENSKETVKLDLLLPRLHSNFLGQPFYWGNYWTRTEGIEKVNILHTQTFEKKYFQALFTAWCQCMGTSHKVEGSATFC